MLLKPLKKLSLSCPPPLKRDNPFAIPIDIEYRYSIKSSGYVQPHFIWSTDGITDKTLNVIRKG